jgi:hypothetical protein
VQRRELLLQVASVCVKRPLHVVLDDAGQLSNSLTIVPNEVDKMAVVEARTPFAISLFPKTRKSSRHPSSFF